MLGWSGGSRSGVVRVVGWWGGLVGPVWWVVGVVRRVLECSGGLVCRGVRERVVWGRGDKGGLGWGVDG